ncbi:MAG: lipocalin family protein [Chitinophagales bacterium]
MKKLFTLILLPAFLLLSSCMEQDVPADAPQTVESVDLLQYLGLWYELASYPQFFNIGCNCTTAEYSLLSSGKVKVVNKCRLFSGQGPISRSDGTAVPVEGSNGTKLTVSFLPNNQGSDNGNYWIIELADDYSYAVVSDPFRNTWFLLSRTPVMDTDLMNDIIDRAVADGFDRNNIKMTNQDCG